MYISHHVKYLLFLSDFNETRIFLKYIQKNSQMSYWMKISPVGAELFHAGRQRDRRTDRPDIAGGHFLQFCKRAK